MTGEGVVKESKSVAENIIQAERLISDQGADPNENKSIVDCDASSSRVHWMEGISPCITKAIGRGHGSPAKRCG